jgi:Protein of unknown function (DUF2948)
MLRLLAQDSADIAVVASLLQDAVILRQDMVFDRQRRHFVMLVQRYRWEQDKTRTRVRSALKIDFVDVAKVRGTLPDVLSLLDITATRHSDDADDPSMILTLLFSGSLTLKFEVDSLSVSLEDITGPWSTNRTPQHDGG